MKTDRFLRLFGGIAQSSKWDVSKEISLAELALRTGLTIG